MATKLNQNQNQNRFLVECAWEVCNQVGGIYTVIRSKVPAATSTWGNNYLLVGPYFHNGAMAEFEMAELGTDPISRAVQAMRDAGYHVAHGYWLVSGRPRVVLMDFHKEYHRLGEVKFEFFNNHQLPIENVENLVDQVLLFGHMVKEFAFQLCNANNGEYSLLGHFHEYMAATALPGIRQMSLPIHTVFTTHATLLGRYLAMNSPDFYGDLPFIDWLKEARYFNVETVARLERAAASSCHVFTTVSEVTARECVQLLGRRPDYILPNGLNIERFVAMHEFQNLHLKYKEKIHEFIMGHFFSSYSFDLDKTLYFFTSGRFEYKNKGFDLTLEALARLNHWLKSENSELTVVMFMVTKQPYTSINPFALQSRAVMEEVRDTVKSIERNIGEKLFYAAAATHHHSLPDLNAFVDDYWKLRLRRTLQSWKSYSLPLVVTHNLVDDQRDEILNFVRNANLINHPDDRVKIVYHPDFIAPTNPLFGMEYGQFVRGCHLGVFPSYYEPWGYTPLECIASGVPTVTSNLSGFGDYVMNSMPDHDEAGIYIVDRVDKGFDQAAQQLTESLYRFCHQNRRERITQRNRTESNSPSFGWSALYKYYEIAYDSLGFVSLN